MLRIDVGRSTERSLVAQASMPNRPCSRHAIIVTAGAAAVPSRLLDQLAVGGRLIMLVGDVAADEQLLVYRREGAGFTICSLGPAVFVPLTGTNAPEAARPPETSRFCYGRATT